MQSEQFKEEIVGKFSLKMRPGFEGGPNVSTLLGSWNINTKKFRDEFEVKTEKLPEYFIMKLTILIKASKELVFLFSNISLAYLLKLISFEGFIKKKGPGGYIKIPVIAVTMQDFLKCVVYKFGKLNEMNIRKAYGTLRSTEIIILERDE